MPILEIDIAATFGTDPRQNCANIMAAAPGWIATFNARERCYVCTHPNFHGDRPLCGSGGLGLSISGNTASDVLARIAALPGILRVTG